MARVCLCFFGAAAWGESSCLEEVLSDVSTSLPAAACRILLLYTLEDGHNESERVLSLLCACDDVVVTL